MEFADGRCCYCGTEFGKAKPKKTTKVKEPYTNQSGRVVQIVAPCPSCGKKIPLWGGNEPEPELTEAEPETEPEVATETEPEVVAEPESKAS